MNISKSKIPYFLLLPTIILLLSIGIFPLIYSLYFSFFDFNLFYIDEISFIGLGNFVALFKNPVFLHSFSVTFRFTAVVVPVELLLGLGLALLMKDEETGESAIRTIMLIPIMLAPIAAGYLWKYMFWPREGIIDTVLSWFGASSLGWTSSHTWALPALMIVDIWQWTPFAFLILISGIRSLPKEPFEAAKIDGAGRWSTFIHLTLPLMRNILLVVILFRLMDAIKLFDQVYVVTMGGPGYETYTTSFYLYDIGLAQTFNIGQGAAGSWILNIIIMILALSLLRMLVKRGE